MIYRVLKLGCAKFLVAVGPGQMLEADRRLFCDAKKLTGLWSPVAGDDMHFGINRKGTWKLIFRGIPH